MGWSFEKLKTAWPFRRRKQDALTRTLIVRAKFDSAQTTPDNRKHWANADGLSANLAANPEVRRVLRNRARHEVANNSYARGIVLTLANDVIGTGPRLQMLLNDGSSSGANHAIETEFAAWAKAVDLPAKLRTMRMARAQDGEAFCAERKRSSRPSATAFAISASRWPGWELPSQRRSLLPARPSATSKPR
jgi:capsid protein